MEILENTDLGNASGGTGEIVVYQPDEITRLEVRLQDDTVWLTQAQMVELFERDQSVIARHIRNIFEEGELEKDSNMQILHNTLSKYKPISTYSLDVIISVGYRIKSQRGTRFRQWANKILKEYLIRGYAFDQRLELHAKTLAEHELLLIEHSKKIDFFVRTSLPPVEGIFFDGQIYDAYTFVANLVRKATRRIVLIDNYIGDTVLTILSKREAGVEAGSSAKKAEIADGWPQNALCSYAFMNIPSRYNQMLSAFWSSLSMISLNVINFI